MLGDGNALVSRGFTDTLLLDRNVLTDDPSLRRRPFCLSCSLYILFILSVSVCSFLFYACFSLHFSRKFFFFFPSFFLAFTRLCLRSSVLSHHLECLICSNTHRGQSIYSPFIKGHAITQAFRHVSIITIHIALFLPLFVIYKYTSVYARDAYSRI